jgi:arginyl-tRNA--protein-N-Asp/Glu arginylyltransferase
MKTEPIDCRYCEHCVGVSATDGDYELARSCRIVTNKSNELLTKIDT